MGRGMRRIVRSSGAERVAGGLPTADACREYRLAAALAGLSRKGRWKVAECAPALRHCLRLTPSLSILHRDFHGSVWDTLERWNPAPSSATTRSCLLLEKVGWGKCGRRGIPSSGVKSPSRPFPKSCEGCGSVSCLNTKPDYSLL